MDKQKRMLAKKVLGYWFALEFLAQDKYPDSWEITGRIRKQKESVAKGTGKQKTVGDFIALTEKDAGKNLYKIIADEAAACGMTKWGNLTVYIGRVKREKCIDCIAEVLPFSPEDGGRPEHSTDKIAWASLQISPEGDYIDRSLSLSTIIWALSQIKTAKGDISRSLDDKLYSKAVEELEKKFFARGQESGDGQALADGAVSLSRLHDLYKEIEKRYIKGNIENNGNERDAYEEVYGVSFQLFADEAEKSKKEEDNYLGLSHDYFSDDIRMVFEQTENGALEEDGYLGRELLDYVTVLHKPDLQESRIDLVAPKRQGRREYLKQLSEILSIENAPLGKWPSRFMPALMQQIAVNLSIHKGTSALYGAGGRVWSGISDSCTVLDEDFVEELLSEEVHRATGAQVANPWFTQRYNREREKLFGYAMRLNKEFVISSNHCRDNFITLSHYWGLRPGDENERIVFHREDKENMVPALFQTLFLLVPVISSTFASVGSLLKDVRQTGTVGMLVVDEAGQAQPQMALGALYRSRRAVIVGDPKQVEPVVTDDLILLRKAYNDDDLKPYKNKTLSVQGFADQMNLFGTWLDNGTDYPEWVGCPLLVHRRCISPMYDISNEISYGGIMKQQTRGPKPERAEKFIFDRSRWIDVKGKEKGNKNHFVEAQGEKVCELLETAFSKNPEPGLYIISPFTSVVSGIRDYIKQYCRKNSGVTKINSDYMLDYEQKKIGTVHTFQGKEAD